MGRNTLRQPPADEWRHDEGQGARDHRHAEQDAPPLSHGKLLSSLSVAWVESSRPTAWPDSLSTPQSISNSAALRITGNGSVCTKLTKSQMWLGSSLLCATMPEPLMPEWIR